MANSPFTAHRKTTPEIIYVYACAFLSGRESTERALDIFCTTKFPFHIFEPLYLRGPQGKWASNETVWSIYAALIITHNLNFPAVLAQGCLQKDARKCIAFWSRITLLYGRARMMWEWVEASLCHYTNTLHLKMLQPTSIGEFVFHHREKWQQNKAIGHGGEFQSTFCLVNGLVVTPTILSLQYYTNQS